MSRRIAGIAAIAALAGVLWMSRETRPVLVAEHALETRLKPFAMVTTVDVAGVGELPMFVNPEDLVITPQVWAGQVWEETETHWFVESLRPGDVVVDVGANIGHYTLIAGRLVGDGGRVYAFEPDPVAFSILERNVRLNGLHNVVLEQKAVADAPGSIRLYLSDENKGDHRIYQPEGEHRPSVEVEAVTLDDYFEGVEESVDFVKIDTQGAELAIVRGASGLLRRSDAWVMAIEYSPLHLAGLGATGEELLDEITGLAPKMYDIGLGGRGIRPLRPIRREQLLRRYSPTSKFFTNLLLVVNRPDVLAKIEAQLPEP